MSERIIINEINQTESRVVLSDVFNVLVILPSTSTYTDDYKLYESAQEFKKVYNKDDIISYAVTTLINSGLGVCLLKNISTESIAKFSDKFKYDISFVIDLATDDSTHHAIIDSLINSRKDVVYLVSDFSSSEEETLNLIKSVSSTNASYKAVHSPAVKITSGAGVGTLPASYCFLLNFAQSVANGTPAWYAIAGVNRGLVNYISGTVREITMDEASRCQEVTKTNYNPIINLSNTYGHVIYGQRTLHDKNDALKSLNIRIISNMIKKRIFNICTGLLFEQNDLVLWNEFRGLLEPYLANMRYHRGIDDYEIVMDQKTQNDAKAAGEIDDLTVKGYVRVKPTRSAEYFNIDFVLTDAGAEVE